MIGVQWPAHFEVKLLYFGKDCYSQINQITGPVLNTLFIYGLKMCHIYHWHTKINLIHIIHCGTEVRHLQ